MRNNRRISFANVVLIICTVLLFICPRMSLSADLEDGEHKEYYKGNRIKRIWNVKDGKSHGSWVSFHKNGTKNEVLDYKKGYLNGEQKKYFDSGNIEQEWNMLKGKKQGIEKKYFGDGHIKSIKNYKNNRMDGEQKFYRSSGLIHRERYYKNGKLSGTQKDYWLNGNISVISKYKNGKLHGKFKTFSPSGELLKTSLYEEGKPLRTQEENYRLEKSNKIKKVLAAAKSVRKEYYDTGELKSISQFKGSMLHGLVKEYFENGGSRSVKHYIEGLEDGIQIMYFDNGNVASRNFYKEGKYDGIQEYFYRNGVLRARERYSRGVLDGLQEYYYENGVLMARKVYAQGNLLRLQKFVYEDGVLKTIEELIENQLIVREVIADKESRSGVNESQLADIFISADYQEYYENGNLKIELQVKNPKLVFERIYYEEGGLKYELKWSGSNNFYYESYSPFGDMEGSEYVSVYKKSELIQHDEFCKLLNGVQGQNGCDIPTADADKPCKSSSDCQAMCLAYGVQPEDQVQGKCSTTSLEFVGCYSQVEEGIAGRLQGDCPT